MITFLDGKLVSALPTQATIDVGGVGYEVFIPLSSYDKLPVAGQPIRILTHLAVREDAHILYGFMTSVERDLFRLLVNNVSGIGPKLALAVLSGMSVNNFKAAVVNSDITAISKISGLGKKTAERIVLELKDKLHPHPKKNKPMKRCSPSSRLVTNRSKRIKQSVTSRRKAKRSRRKNWSSSR